jgi:hypothetical protein
MKSIHELRVELASVFTGLKEGTIEPKAAIEMNNAAGKIINSAKVELDYARAVNTTPYIPFLAPDYTEADPQ